LKIILDAGHGPNTAGKRTPDGTMKEFEFNSSVINKIKHLLQAYENIDIMYAHEVTRDVPLSERTTAANRWNADLYLSVHANAYGDGSWNDVQGIETFVHTSKPQEAFNLAIEIQNQLIRATGRPNRNVKSADFHVLRETNMTAILVECGFMTNKEEAELLKSEAYRQTCAQALVNGLVQFYKLTKKETVKKPNLYRVQVGAYAKLENAEQVKNQLIKDGYPVFIVRE
jgi:N-acetylmuramoyl-L-alanine amidase